jgi:hypothetical protein
MKLQDLLLESDEKQLAHQLKQVLDKEMEDGQLDEGLTAVGILSWLLASNTVLDILGKYSAKALRKMNLNQAADKAEAVHNWAHNNEKAMVNVIAQVISPFVKDGQKKTKYCKRFIYCYSSRTWYQSRNWSITSYQRS